MQRCASASPPIAEPAPIAQNPVASPMLQHLHHLLNRVDNGIWTIKLNVMPAACDWHSRAIRGQPGHAYLRLPEHFLEQLKEPCRHVCRQGIGIESDWFRAGDDCKRY